ncbi:zinc finger transcription factor [Histoplasma capsulatum var. duboisii H88]|uniref:Zinc finger transcription factor n=1 Tax=Ajellomyces capsulatus (strain H88) TaxID=544711 RepID=F0U974_AJEC8|nr:zinc finger transcription factor [Histoplasma capsulatum var. duboisii H88]QSS52541.1 zinc finger transcription factor 1 [Histoplasma capsulatum var. duboisii H88]
MEDGVCSESSSSSRDQVAQGVQEDMARQNKTATNTGDFRDFGESSVSARGHGDTENPRPWSELKTKAGKERKRLPLACIACRRKKIRCSGEKPACRHCYRSRTPCVYKVTTRKAAPRTDYMAMLDRRLKKMEERVIKIIPKNGTRDMAAIGRSVVKPPAPGQISRGSRPAHRKRPADEAFRAELNEWRQPNKGNPTSWQPRIEDDNKLLNEGAEFLPSTELQEHLAEVFFDCVYGQSYLLLHKPSFMRKLKSGTVPPVLMLAICAVSARFSTHPLVSTEPAFLRGDNWANPAAAIALSRHDEPSITMLTVFIILGLHEFGACHGGRSWSFGGQAFRMAYALQLHRELDDDPRGNSASEFSFTDREIRRRTMWACVLMDRYNSSGSQRPPIGNEKFLRLQLPIKESYFQMEIPGPTEDLEGKVLNPLPEGVGQLSNPKENMGVSAYTIRALMLWGRAVDYLNLGGRNRDPHPLWSPKSGYSQLKKQLEDFSASLPNSLAFSLENLRNHAATKIANQFLFLHIVIHQNILFLNRFAIPLSPGAKPPKDIPRTFLSDAGRAAVEAANHISMLVNQAPGYNLTVPFAGYSAYAASTVHIWGLFSKNPRLEATSKENLRHSYGYLNKMKRYWGMFHYMVQSTKDRYRLFADASIKGVQVSSSEEEDAPLFQYGDWFDKYPYGLSRRHYTDPPSRPLDAVMAQHYGLQSAEDFFASLSPPSHSDNPRKEPRRRTGSSTEPRQPALNSINSNNQYTSPQQQPQSSSQPPSQPPPQSPPQQQPQPQRQLQQVLQHAIVDVPINPTRPPDFNLNTHAMLPPAQAPNFSQSTYFPMNPDQLPQLDRQFVYDAHTGHDPTSTTSTSPQMPNPIPVNPPARMSPTPNVSTQQGPNLSSTVWNSQFDMSGAPATWSGEFAQPGAWFLPFNLNPVGRGLLDMNANPVTNVDTTGPRALGIQALANNPGPFPLSNVMMGAYGLGV